MSPPQVALPEFHNGGNYENTQNSGNETDLNLDCSGGGGVGELLVDPNGRRRCSSRCRICDPTDVDDGTEKRPGKTKVIRGVGKNTQSMFMAFKDYV